MIFYSPWMMEMFLCLLFRTCQQPLTQQTIAYYFTDFIMILEYKARPSIGFHPTLQTALSLSASIATYLSQLPFLSVFHRDQPSDLSSSFSIQLLFLL